MQRVWVINPDAEQELLHHRLRPGSPYQAPASLYKATHDMSHKFRHLTEQDALIMADYSRGATLCDAPPREVSCWCPTANLRQLVERCWGLTLRAPSMDVLAQCNDKLLVSTFTSCLEERAPVQSVAELDALILERRWGSGDAQSKSVGDGARATVRLKRRFGQAGRGQRRVNEFLSADDRRFIKDSQKWGGLIVEPELDVVNNLSIHGVVSPAGLLTGAPCSFQTDRFSSPNSTLVVVDESSSSRTDELRRVAEDVAATLEHLGYFGPFGLDFIVTQAGRLALVDINARFTLGFSTGLGRQRDAALALIDCAMRPS